MLLKQILLMKFMAMDKNKYTQREWDRAVGYGSVPDEYNAEKIRYLYRVKYLEPYAKGESEELYRFIPADNVQDAILTAGIKHKVGNFYGSPILEVVVDKQFY